MKKSLLYSKTYYGDLETGCCRDLAAIKKITE